jgi:2-oxoglutarate ferredoxin oxidoreductase subunit alpha
MQEGLSYIAGSEVPCVVVDIMRGGPGLGNIQPGQADYFQLTRSAGHGDFHPLVLAPATVQEAVDLMYISFDLAFHYRTIVIVAGDGALGQMMEPVTLPPMRAPIHERPAWALTGVNGRQPNIITSLYLEADELEQVNLRLQAKLARIAAAEQRWECYLTDDADFLVVAFGTVARIARSAVRAARAAGIRAGLFRPISLWPFPAPALDQLVTRMKGVVVAEMNAGQMVEDVRMVVRGRAPVRFLGRTGGVIPLPDEIAGELMHMARIDTQANGT